MSLTSSVSPPTVTPGGWYGCFGVPFNSTTPNPVANPASGQLPCGNGTIESCCVLGDQCLSNGVCMIQGDTPIYYGSYCTDPTFTSEKCAPNCPWRYMSYCGSNIWQCLLPTGPREVATCTLDAIQFPNTTFWMVQPTKLATGLLLPTAEPPTTQSQYIPTQWGIPQSDLVASITTSPILTNTPTSSSGIQETTSRDVPASSNTQSQASPKSAPGRSLSAGDIAGICGAIIGFIAIITGFVGALYNKEIKKWLARNSDSRASQESDNAETTEEAATADPMSNVASSISPPPLTPGSSGSSNSQHQ